MNLKALHSISYGLYVIGSRKGDRLNGQIANTVIQVSSEPPTISVCINKGNLSHEFIKESKVFAASTLCQSTPLTFIGQFGFNSGRDINKFEGINYKTGETGSPIVLDNAVAWLEVMVTQEIDAGTHTIFIGKVIDAGVVSDDVCMTYDYYHQIKDVSDKQYSTLIDNLVLKNSLDL